MLACMCVTGNYYGDYGFGVWMCSIIVIMVLPFQTRTGNP